MLSKRSLGRGKVRVTFTMPKLEGVKQLFLVGDFNNWSVSETPLTRAADETWSVALSLEGARFAIRVDAVRALPSALAPLSKASSVSSAAIRISPSIFRKHTSSSALAEPRASLALPAGCQAQPTPAPLIPASPTRPAIRTTPATRIAAGYVRIGKVASPR